MTAKHFTELDAWKLADELESFVTRLLERTVWRDAKLLQQINESSSSAPSNIAEGFGRFGPPSFAHFLSIAIGSEFETANHLIRAARRRYITAADRDEGMVLAKRASKAAINLRHYVLSPEGRANARRIEDRRRSRR
jgi:four helix bundle protein